MKSGDLAVLWLTDKWQ